MKTLFEASDDLYRAALHAVRTVEGLHGTLPQCRTEAQTLKKALQTYEDARFSRREVVIGFRCPTPPREILDRTLGKEMHTPEPKIEPVTRDGEIIAVACDKRQKKTSKA